MTPAPVRIEGPSRHRVDTLPSNYGSGGITPPGETEPGWWMIEYQITAAGNDTTTWEVNIRGNPVHLVTP